MEKKDEVEKNEMDIFLAWLSPELEHSTILYLELRRKIVFMFRFFNEPEDLASEVIERTLNNIKNGKVKYDGKAEHYVSRVAHFVKMEQYRKKNDFQLDETINDLSSDLHENSFPEELYAIIEECLDELSPDERELFLEYSTLTDDLPDKDHRQNVATKRNITIKHLRVIIHRVKNKLRVCARNKLGETQ